MPFVAGTPEALGASLQRRDSKDFNTTCRGVNISGTPCRTRISGKVSALKTTIDGKEEYFCWRHKEQAKALIQQKSKVWDSVGLQRRDTMEVLVDKVMAMAVTDPVQEGKPSLPAAPPPPPPPPAPIPNITPPGGAHPFPGMPSYVPMMDPNQHPYIPPIPPPSSHKHKVVSFISGLFNRISKNSKKNDQNDDIEAQVDPYYGGSGAGVNPVYQSPQQYVPPPTYPSPHAIFKKRNPFQRVKFDTVPMGPPMPQMVPPPQSSLPVTPEQRKPKTPSPAKMRRRMEELAKKSSK